MIQTDYLCSRKEKKYLKRNGSSLLFYIVVSGVSFTGRNAGSAMNRAKQQILICYSFSLASCRILFIENPVTLTPLFAYRSVTVVFLVAEVFQRVGVCQATNVSKGDHAVMISTEK